MLQLWGSRLGATIWRRTSHAKYLSGHVKWACTWKAQEATGMFMKKEDELSILGQI